ncbi:MAG: hypothetical protein HQL75_00235 [Magnetococcales bacterium]|nr:hypothetical protein [Magnetococcales bacterium]
MHIALVPAVASCNTHPAAMVERMLVLGLSQLADRLATLVSPVKIATRSARMFAAVEPAE